MQFAVALFGWFCRVAQAVRYLVELFPEAGDSFVRGL